MIPQVPMNEKSRALAHWNAVCPGNIMKTKKLFKYLLFSEIIHSTRGISKRAYPFVPLAFG